MTKFTINEKEYNAVPFDFNTVCDLEDLGISIEKIADKPVNTMRGYLAICGGMTVSEAGKEISEHIIKGGNLDGLSDAMSAELDNSDFFRTLTQGA